MTKLELYDCTLRDGAQAAGANYDLAGRVKLFSQLDDFGMDYVELGWPVTSDMIMKSFEECKKVQKKAKIVAFGSTSIKQPFSKDRKLSSILESRAEYACIFGKSHPEHVEKQLRVSLKHNLDSIKESVKFLRENGLSVFYDAEHFFDAFKLDKTYALETLVAAADGGAQRLVLCDTNGGLEHGEAKVIVGEVFETLKNLGVPLGIHFHNDFGIAVSNALDCLPYVVQVQGTINGIGERAGNLDLSTFIANYERKLKLPIASEKLKEVSDSSYHLTSMVCPPNKPIVGDLAFAQKAGIHINAIRKGLVYRALDPKIYGNREIILLNSWGGISGTIAVAEQYGLTLDDSNPEVIKTSASLKKKLEVLEEQRYNLDAIPAEQFMLVQTYFGNFKNYFTRGDYSSGIEMVNGSERSRFFMEGVVNDQAIASETRVLGGQVDAAYKHLKDLLSKDYPLVKDLKLEGYEQGIAIAHEESSTVRTLFTFEGTERFQTVGVNSSSIESCLEALTKGFNYYLNRVYGANSKLNK